MMLRHIGFSQHADIVEAAILKTIREAKVYNDMIIHNNNYTSHCCSQVLTGDLGGSSLCSQYTAEIINNL